MEALDVRRVCEEHEAVKSRNQAHKPHHLHPIIMKFAVFVCLAVFWLSAAECSKILVFICEFAKSHQIVYHPIIRELAARGHEVDFYTHHPLDNPPKTLNQFKFAEKDFSEHMKPLENLVIVQQFQSIISLVYHMRKSKLEDFSLTECFAAEQVKELLASNKSYDLVMGEFPFAQEEFSYFAHKFKALAVLMQSLPDNHWLNEISGFPNNPSYMLPFTTYYTDKMPFFERLTNFFEIQLAKTYDYYYVSVESQRIADKYLRYEGWESRPPLLKQVSDLALILVSGHPSLGYAYPKAPHVKEVLGTNVEENPPPLPKDIQEFMDSAEHGVVYFSFGSILGLKMLQAYNAYEPVLKVLSGLEQKVLWKWTSWSGEEPPHVPNIKFLKWMPQQSVLAHNKTRLFMTHGGLGGLTEAVYHGVPLIGFPIFGDQQKNVRLLTELGIGVTLQLDNVTEASLTWAINQVLNNQKYKQEVLKRSAMFKDRPMKPVDEAVYWIEYVLRHGNVLQPAAAQMPFYQLYLLDVIGFIAICSAIFFFVSIRLLKYVVRFVKYIIADKRTKTAAPEWKGGEPKKQK